jgi:protein STE50
MEQAEEQLRQLAQAYSKLRQELIPVFKMAKERLEPLPNVPGYHVPPSSSEPYSLEVASPPAVQPPPEKTGLVRTLSLNKKKLFLPSGPKNHSPTHIPSTIHEGKALSDPSSLDPSAAATAASNNLTAAMSYSALPPANSPSAVPQPSPTSPLPYQPPMLANRSYRDGGGTPSGGRNMHDYTDEVKPSRPAPSNTPPNARDPPNSATSMNSNVSSRANATNNHFSTATTVVQSAHNSMNGPTSSTPMPTSASGAPTPSAEPPSVEIFKSFRVGLDDPCHKVLPAALRKYNIQADWRQYALYIVYGDQERCVDLDEKPLALFKDLDREGKKPMFMLRKLAPPTDTPGSASMRQPGSGVGGVPMSSAASVRTVGTLPPNVPGGVL